MDVPDRHIELWIEPASDPITGRMTQAGGKARRFAGWVELTAAIEATRCGRDLGEGALPSAALADLQNVC